MDNRLRNEGKRTVVTRLLAADASQHPLLIVVEDIHWADPLTLAHLSAMASTVAKCPSHSGHDLAGRRRPAGPSLAILHRRQPTHDNRSRSASSRRGGSYCRESARVRWRARARLHRQSRRQSPVPRAAFAQCLGGRARRDPGDHPELGASAHGSPSTEGQGSHPGRLHYRPTLHYGGAASPVGGFDLRLPALGAAPFGQPRG